MAILKPKIVITYQGKDVSADFAPILQGVTFKDTLDGRAGEAEISLSNAQGYFFNDWYPEIDHHFTILMGYEDTPMIDGGTFWVDEISLSGSSSGDTCNIRALSLKSSNLNSSIKKQYHNARPIADIVSEVAAELGCTVKGDLSGNFSGLQNETGLQFLNRIAHQIGHILKVEGTDLVFYPIAQLGEIGELEIKRSDVRSYSLKDIAAGRISKCIVKWWDSKTKKEIGSSYSNGIKGGGEVVLWQEVENASEAKTKAKDYITDRNKSGVEFSIEMLGDVRLRAGVAINMVGFGSFDKTYYVSEATHSFSSSGYTTFVTLQTKEK